MKHLAPKQLLDELIERWVIRYGDFVQVLNIVIPILGEHGQIGRIEMQEQILQPWYRTQRFVGCHLGGITSRAAQWQCQIFKEWAVLANLHDISECNVLI